LPESVDKDLRELAGDDLTGWQKAIAEQVQREKEERTQVSAEPCKRNQRDLVGSSNTHLASGSSQSLIFS